jgi:hypothetical protein
MVTSSLNINLKKRNNEEGSFFKTQYKYRYSYTYAYSIPMSTFERLSWLDLEIHEVGHQERVTVEEDDIFH